MEAKKLTFHKQQNTSWLHLQVHHKRAPQSHLQTPENQICQQWNHQDSSTYLKRLECSLHLQKWLLPSKPSLEIQHKEFFNCLSKRQHKNHGIEAHKSGFGIRPFFKL